MLYERHNRGQSLIEMLFAVAVFTIGVVTIGYLVFDSFTSLRFGKETMQARLLASEGLEAVRTIYEDDFALLESGTYGLALQNGVWEFSSSTEEIGIFTRTIVITERDQEMRDVTATVAWGEAPREKSFALSTIFTNWEQESEDAAFLEVDINNASLISSSTVLTGVALRNTGAEDVIVTQMKAQWGNEETFSDIVIRGTTVMSASTSPAAVSDETVNITDYVVGSGTGYHLIDSMVFSGDMSETNLLLTFILADGSKKHAFVVW